MLNDKRATPKLGLDLLAFRFASFAIGWASAVIRLLQPTMWLGHVNILLKFMRFITPYYSETDTLIGSAAVSQSHKLR